LPTEPAAAAAEPATDEPVEPAAAAADNAADADPAKEDTAGSDAPTTSAEPAAAAAEPVPGDPAAAETAVDVRTDQATDTVAAEPVAEPSKLEPEMLRLISETGDLSDDDRSALTAFYEGRSDDLLWISSGAFNARAEAALAEIRRADDWGL